MPEAIHKPMSRGLANTIDDLRDRFLPYLRTWDALIERRRDLAKPFMQGFRLWRRETGRSFVAFVQQIDKTVPVEKTGYMAHRSYQAALYLRRLDEAPQTVAGRTERKSRTHFDLLAIMIRSVLQLPTVRPHEVDVWQALARVGHMHQRDLQRLQQRVKRVHPIVLSPDVPRLVYKDRASKHMSPSTETGAAAGA